jgi:proteasome component ECM29
MAASAAEKRELELLDKIDFRILGVASNEAKLTALLGTYLCPIILKVASEHKSVRDKVSAVHTRGRYFLP